MKIRNPKKDQSFEVVHDDSRKSLVKSLTDFSQSVLGTGPELTSNKII